MTRSKRKKLPAWIEFSLTYWKPLGAIGALLLSGVVFLATLQPRVTAMEKRNQEQDQDIIDLKGISQQLDGYIKSQTETNRLLMQIQQQQYSNQPMPMPADAPSMPARLPVVWEDVDRFGQRFCCNEVRREDCRRWQVCP